MFISSIQRSKWSTARLSLAAAAVASMVWAPAALSQTSTIDAATDELTIQFDEVEGTPLDDFIKLGEQLLGVQMTFESADTKDIRLRILGPRKIKKDQFWSYFQAVIKSKDFVVVPYGSPSVPGRPGGDGAGYFAIRRSTGGVGGATKPGFIRSRAPVVTPAQLTMFKNDTGLVLTTAFQLEHVNAQEMVNMLQTYFSDPMVESVRAVADSNSLVATGYGPSLGNVQALITLIDVEVLMPKRAMMRFPLEHAVAQEVRPIIQEFFQSESPDRGRGNQGYRGPTQPLLPVVQADARTNALLVLGTEEQHEKVTAYVSGMDVPVGGPASVSIIALQYADAHDVANVLRQLSQDPSMRVVADERTNSLLIAAPEERVREMQAIAQSLDIDPEK